MTGDDEEFIHLIHRSSSRRFIQLRIALGWHLIEKGRPEPSREDDRRTRDKTTGIHQVLRKCLLLPAQVLVLFPRNSNTKYAPSCADPQKGIVLADCDR